MRRMLLPLLVLALALPATAAAQGDPFGPPPLPAPAPQQPQQPQPTFADQQDDGLGTTQTLLVFGGAALLLVGIGWLILRDAGQHAPADKRERRAAPARGVPTGDVRDPDARPAKARAQGKARNRARAKRARQARKANR
jgi:hypothetical protein